MTDFDISKMMINDLTLAAIRAESARAIQKHTWEKTPLNPARDRGLNLAVLTEELGEVAEILCDVDLGVLNPEEAHARIMKELAQVANVAAMWLECEDVRGSW